LHIKEYILYKKILQWPAEGRESLFGRQNNTVALELEVIKKVTAPLKQHQ